MEMVVREQYAPLLQMYRLNPEHLEEHGSVLKVYTNQGPYALKRLGPSRMERSSFVHHLRFLSEKGFTNYAPVYHASDGEYFLSDGDNQYYLMPWLDGAEQKGEENDHYHQMFQTLAKMHQKTVREEQITEEIVENHYNTLSSQWEQDRDMLDTFLTQSEAKWYMSPLELQYCTYYHHILRAHEFAAKQLEEWQEMMKEQETTRISLIHGNVSQNHFLYDHERNGYFISMENSQFSTPVQDIVQFYSRSFYTYPIARNDRYEWYQMYQKQFPYTKEEKKLMLAYLAYPQQFIRQITRYVKSGEQRDERSELHYVKSLQQTHWLVSNIEYFVSQIQQVEHQAQQQSEQQT